MTDLSEQMQIMPLTGKRKSAVLRLQRVMSKFTRLLWKCTKMEVEKHNSMIEKKTLRAKMRDQLGQIDRIKRKERSIKAANYLLASSLWQQAQIIFLFVSMPNEIDTTPLLEAAWQEGKYLYLPKVEGQEGMMRFLPCHNAQELQPGAYGILEPSSPEQDNLLPPPPPQLIIVPGYAFGDDGERLGKGGGYYDRFLVQFEKSAFLMGFGFAVQYVHDLPEDKHDVRMHGLCTEQGLTFFK